MADPLAVLVLGAEATGTRLMTGILIAAGCVGSAQGVQPLDYAIPTPGQQPIVWRRSVPHAHQWPDVVRLIDTLRSLGYAQVAAVVTTRDWQATVQSQVQAGHVADQAQAWRNLQKAYPLIMSGLDTAHAPHVMVNYESLVQRPGRVIAWIMGRFGFFIPTVEIYDGNEKWLT